MNRTFFIIGLFATMTMSSAVLAETVQQTCDAKNGAVASVTQQQAANAGAIESITAQIAALRAQMQDLNTQKAVKKKEGATLKGDLRKAEAAARKACFAVELCKKDKEQLEKLKVKLAELKTEATSLRKEIAAKSAQVAALQKKVGSYQAAYTQFNCAELVAGQTAQTTIDKCNDIFTNWNTDQAAINTLNAELGQTKALANRLRGKSRALMGRIIAQAKRIRANCAGDAILGQLDALEKEDTGIDKMLADIDIAKKDLAATKKIRMIRPRVKKAPKVKQPAVAPKTPVKAPPQVAPKK